MSLARRSVPSSPASRALVLPALVAAFLAPPSVASDLDLEPRPIASRDGRTYEAEVGRIEVPENRSDPESRTISLAFVRVRSPLADPGPPVFVLAGGPGGSSIAEVERHVTGGGRMYLELLGGDVIGVDQRGVGESRPNLDTDARFDLPLEEPGDPARRLEAMRAACREEAARWRADGVDLDGYTTVESADDVDAVRRALGYEKVSLWGASYGTHLALATIRRHGEHVARAVLVGPEGPDQTNKLPSATQAGLELLAAKVKADPGLGEVIPDLVGLVRTVLDRLEEAPAFVEVDGLRVGVSAFDVRRWIANHIGLVHDAAVKVPANVVWMAEGDFDAIARDLLDERRDWRIGSAMSWVMDAASGSSAARTARIAREAEECLLRDAVNFPFTGLGDAWGAPDLGDAYRGPLRSEVPILFIAGDLDSRTPVTNAQELMEHLPNARLITVENAAHDVNWVQKELREAWGAFLAGDEPTITRVVAPPIRFVRP